jgi:hypothetical protein
VIALPGCAIGGGDGVISAPTSEKNTVVTPWPHRFTPKGVPPAGEVREHRTRGCTSPMARRGQRHEDDDGATRLRNQNSNCRRAPHQFTPVTAIAQADQLSGAAIHWWQGRACDRFTGTTMIQNTSTASRRQPAPGPARELGRRAPGQRHRHLAQRMQHQVIALRAGSDMAGPTAAIALRHEQAGAMPPMLIIDTWREASTRRNAGWPCAGAGAPGADSGCSFMAATVYVSASKILWRRIMRRPISPLLALGLATLAPLPCWGR